MVKILVVGDSLSAAYNLPIEAGWVNLLEQHLNTKGFNTEFINASVSGATTAMGLQTAKQALLEHQPDWLLLELGANDGLQGKALSHIKNNLSEIIELAQKQGVSVALIGTRLPPNYGAAYTEPYFTLFADLAAHYKLAYVPFLLEGVAGHADLMMADRLHPRAEAQPIIMEYVARHLIPYLKSP